MEKIVFLDGGTVRVPLRRPSFAHEWREYPSTKPAQVAERLQDATIAITNKVALREPVLAQRPQLRLIAVTATGVDCVDVDYCRRRKIAVCNVPGYAQHSVAEHVFMLVLALRRSLIPLHGAVQSGGWSRSEHFAILDYPLRDLHGASLGLIGYGDIARHVEAIARGFGMKVLVAERKGASALRPGRLSFEEVLRQADVVSLHAPKTQDTVGLIGAAELAMMKREAILINTGRGGLVEEAALAAALKAGRLAGAAIDVLSQEPPPDDHPLLKLHLPNLIVTPHVGWASEQAVAKMAAVVTANLEAFVGGKAQNLVTK